MGVSLRLPSLQKPKMLGSYEQPMPQRHINHQLVSRFLCSFDLWESPVLAFLCLFGFYGDVIHVTHKSASPPCSSAGFGAFTKLRELQYRLIAECARHPSANPTRAEGRSGLCRPHPWRPATCAPCLDVAIWHTSHKRSPTTRGLCFWIRALGLSRPRRTGAPVRTPLPLAAEGCSVRTDSTGLFRHRLADRVLFPLRAV